MSNISTQEQDLPSDAVMHLRIPSLTKAKFVASSKAAGTSLSSWAIRRLERAAAWEEVLRLVKCEVCGGKPAEYFSAARIPLAGWQFTCDCNQENEIYWLKISDFHGNPTKWIHHLCEKHGVDTSGFIETLSRYQAQVYAALDGKRR